MDDGLRGLFHHDYNLESYQLSDKWPPNDLLEHYKQLNVYKSRHELKSRSNQPAMSIFNHKNRLKIL